MDEEAARCATDVLGKLSACALPDSDSVLRLIRHARAALEPLPSLVRIQVPVGASLHVVGDLHGQYAELETVLKRCHEPEDETNYFVFNGDFVDRGARSVEVLLALLARFLLHPRSVHLNRGNHETASLNRRYGFEAEVRAKYPPGDARRLLREFQAMFRELPVAALVNGSVLVVHGGLSAAPGVRLSDIEAIDRRCEPSGDGLMMELLWSDPMDEDGLQHSDRGAGVLFGPDVSRKFCEDNNLIACIRSHQVVPDGYRWQRHHRCLTVFSAANYCGTQGNLGAVCHLRPRGERLEMDDFSFTQFQGARRSRL